MSQSLFMLCQITAGGVRIVSCESKKMLHEWQPSSGKNISVATCNCHQVVCAVGKELYYLEVQSGKVTQVRWAVLRPQSKFWRMPIVVTRRVHPSATFSTMTCFALLEYTSNFTYRLIMTEAWLISHLTLTFFRSTNFLVNAIHSIFFYVSLQNLYHISILLITRIIRNWERFRQKLGHGCQNGRFFGHYFFNMINIIILLWEHFRSFSCIMFKFVLHAANNQFSDNFNNGGGLLSSVLLFQMVFTFKWWLEAEA